MTQTSWLLKHKLLVTAGLFSIAGVVFFVVRWQMGPQVDAQVLVRRDFVQTVVASGHVESPHRVDVGAQITSTVTRIPVNEGDTVKAQDVLIELAAGDLLATERQAYIAVTQAQARLRQIQDLQAPLAEQALRQAKVNSQNAQTVMRRNQDLFRQGFIGEAALDDARKVLELADAQVITAQKQLETTLAQGSDYAIAAVAIRQAQAAVDGAHARSRFAVVRAPVDGVLIGRSVEVGDVVQPGKLLMTLSPKGQAQLVLAIDEKNLRLIRLGQKALVSADAYPQEKFEATVAYISPGVNAQTGSVEVKLTIDQAPLFLLQDMTVSVDIEVARRPATLVVPASSVRDAGSQSPWVVRIDRGRAVKAAVQTGLRSDGFVEILQGLEAGDTVLLGAPLVEMGAPVRTTMPPH
ncbi:MAG: efflux RND transporter periplasmic adaptor subunit [Betaproteobacteria bacterium]